MIEQVFKGGAEEVDDKNIVKAFLAEIIDIRYTSYIVSVHAAVADWNVN